MNESTKTLTYVGLAVAVGLLAIFTRPRAPSAASSADRVGKLLNEVEDPLSATRLSVIQYDEATSALKTFEVEQVNGLWVIPSHQNYPADAERQMAEAAAGVMNRQILGIVSTNPGEHSTYGVIDPDIDKLQAGTVGVGTRVTMQNSKKENLVNLVIGKEVQDQAGQRYVREVGRDPVYVVKLDPSKLSTKFEEWIEDDLLKLNPWDIRDVTLKDYSAELGLGARGIEILWDRRSQMTFSYDDSKSEWQAANLAVFNNQTDQFETVTLAEDEEPNKDKLNDLKTALDDLKIVDVERKPEGLSKDLKAQKDFASNEQAVRSLAERGFMPVQIGEDSFEVLSTDGDVLCQMKDGVEYVLRFGKLVLSADAGGEAAGGNASDEEPSDTADADAKKDGSESRTGVNRYLFVAARFNEAVIEQPKLEELPELPQAAADPPAAEAAAATSESTEEPKATDSQPSEPPAENSDGEGSSEDSSADPNKEQAEPPADQPAAGSPPSDSAAAEQQSNGGETEKPAAAEEPSQEKSDSTDNNQQVKQDENAAGQTDDSAKDTADDAAKDATDKELEKLIEKRKEIEKENQRKLDEYQEKIKKGKQRVDELNSRFGDWYYVISDQVYKKIHLTRDDVIRKKEDKEEDKKEGDSADAAGSEPKSPLGELNELEKSEP